MFLLQMHGRPKSMHGVEIFLCIELLESFTTAILNLFRAAKKVIETRRVGINF